MRYNKWILIGLLAMSVWSMTTISSHASDESLKALLIYATEENRMEENIHMLDATFSAFASEQTVVSVDSFTPELLNGIDMAVLIGDTTMALPNVLIDGLNRFEGEIIAFGYNAEQLDAFAGWEFMDEVEIASLNDSSLSKKLSVIQVIPPEGSEWLATGDGLDGEVPFVVKKGRVSYVATASFNQDEKYLLSELLYPLTGIAPPDAHPAYIRLEDISPVSDPKLVKQTGEYLADRNIPFYLAIIPVYVNNETGEQISMASNRQLVNVLKDLQDRGAMVIGHGYTHSYRYEETGEGFEFWDNQLNQKITTEQTDKLPAPILSRETFSSEEDFNKYMDKIDLVEKRYIERKHKKAIEELVDLGLYPLSFEAPHYTMSSTGYEITSHYFTSIFGQIQLSDENWEVMDAPLFISKPSLLSGMTLYPETIGYADPELADPLEETRKSIDRLKNIPGAMIGGFYHPYLGLEYLQEMVSLINSAGKIEWLDLRTTEQTVKTDNVLIDQQANGVLNVESKRTAWKRLFERLEERPMESVLWGMSVIVVLFIIAFSVYIVNLRAGLKKRLFRERENVG